MDRINFVLSPLMILILASIIAFSFPIGSHALTVATWNVEHLAASNGSGCKSRSSADYLALKRLGESLNADIIALQEVENVDALERIFDDRYELVTSTRPVKNPYKCQRSKVSPRSTHQATAYAIKKGIAFEISEITTLSPFGYNRYALVAKLPDYDLQLINVHLKSGCFDNAENSNSSNCRKKLRQVDSLLAWIEDNGINQQIILGDFNRRLTRAGDTIAAKFNTYTISTQELANCNPKHQYPIDHILSKGIDTTNPRFVSYDDEEFLSDHCPVLLDIDI